MVRSMNLAEKTCTPCRGGVPPLTAQQAEDCARRHPNGRSWTMHAASNVPSGFETSAKR
jgi:hypothetical protein